MRTKPVSQEVIDRYAVQRFCTYPELRAELERAKQAEVLRRQQGRAPAHVGHNAA